MSGQRIAISEYFEKKHQVVVTPLADGELTVHCRDVCLASADDVVAVVTVAGIHSLRVQVSDKVQVGSTIPAYVKVLDRRGNSFTVDQHRYTHTNTHTLLLLAMSIVRFMQLQSNPKSHHIETESTPVSTEIPQSHDLLALSSVFTVLGKAVGHTHLIFNVTTPTGHVISSTPAAIQVFDALKLSPKHIILLPTATFQVCTWMVWFMVVY